MSTRSIKFKLPKQGVLHTKYISLVIIDTGLRRLTSSKGLEGATESKQDREKELVSRLIIKGNVPREQRTTTPLDKSASPA